MKKRLLYLFFTIFICSLGFAENIAWFAPYAAGFNVDLNNTEMYSGAVPDNDGHGRLPQVYFNQNAYNDDTLIAVAGFKTVIMMILKPVILSQFVLLKMVENRVLPLLLMISPLTALKMVL